MLALPFFSQLFSTLVDTCRDLTGIFIVFWPGLLFIVVAIGFIGDYAPCGLQPLIQNMPVIQ